MMSFSFNSKRIYTVFFGSLIFVLLLQSSCSKNDTSAVVTPTPVVLDKVYVSHNLVTIRNKVSTTIFFQLLSLAYPEAAPIANDVVHNVKVYNVTYKTMFKGREIEASGLVCIPDSDNGIFPMISFQNGTNTSHAEAPTVNIEDVLFNALQSTSSTGYIMVMPDYIGFGKSKQFVHPYLHKESTVLSVENLIRATKEMIDTNLVNVNWDNDLYLMGYSQGGWVTLSTHLDISKKTNLPFKVKASSSGAGPYDLAVVQNFMFKNATYPQPVYMAYPLVSFHSLGLITNPLSDYLNEPYASNLPSYFTGQFTNAEVNERLSTTITAVITMPFLTGINSSPKYKDFRDAMSNNSVHGWNTAEPIRLYHGTADIYVPTSTSEKVYQEFMDAGAASNVSYFPIEGRDHSAGAIPMVISSLLWFKDMEQKASSRTAIVN